MADLVGVTSTDGKPRVINVDHVVQVWDMPHNECHIQLSNGETVIARMTAIEFAQLGRMTIGGRSLEPQPSKPDNALPFEQGTAP